MRGREGINSFSDAYRSAQKNIETYETKVLGKTPAAERAAKEQDYLQRVLASRDFGVDAAMKSIKKRADRTKAKEAEKVAAKKAKTAAEEKKTADIGRKTKAIETISGITTLTALRIFKVKTPDLAKDPLVKEQLADAQERIRPTKGVPRKKNEVKPTSYSEIEKPGTGKTSKLWGDNDQEFTADDWGQLMKNPRAHIGLIQRNDAAKMIASAGKNSPEAKQHIDRIARAYKIPGAQRSVVTKVMHETGLTRSEAQLFINAVIKSKTVRGTTPPTETPRSGRGGGTKPRGTRRGRK